MHATMKALPEKPHQPRTLCFPKRSFGQKRIVQVAFKAGWFDQWNWLHYDEPGDKRFAMFVQKHKHGTNKAQAQSTSLCQ